MDRSPRRPWSGRRVVLGVCGGIAAYKVAQVARDLTLLGADVDVVLTPSAAAFVGPITFEGLTGRQVHRELVAPGHALDHIRLARAADVVAVAPATADFLARAAAGRADDLLGALLLATGAPVVVFPAMNDRMWSHPQTRRNAAHLDELGYRLVGPAAGALAHGEGEGPGRLVEPRVVVEHIGRALGRAAPFDGRRLVVSAGPTREAVDPVRFLSNRSSGRMGFAVAAAAWRRGAEVDLITGPSAVEPPVGPTLQRVESAEEMEEAVRARLPGADALVMAAAVADFAPAEPASAKLRRASAPAALPLRPVADILAATRDARPPGLVAMGFALETGGGLDSARAKLRQKGLDFIVLNDASEPGSGFEVQTNRVVVLDAAGGEEELPLLPKEQVAELLLDRLATRLGRSSGHPLEESSGASAPAGARA